MWMFRSISVVNGFPQRGQLQVMHLTLLKPLALIHIRIISLPPFSKIPIYKVQITF